MVLSQNFKPICRSPYTEEQIGLISEEDFKEKKLHPKDLKTAVADAIVKLLDPIQKSFQENVEWQTVEKLAYPDPNAKPEKKKKKVGHTSFRAEFCETSLTTQCRRRSTTLPLRGKGRMQQSPQLL